MATEQLTAYLTDHLAGSRSALDLLEHLEFVHNDMLLAVSSPSCATMTADRQALEALMEQQQIAPSRTRQAMAGSVTQVMLC
jgi:hypothetical protein